MANIQPQSEIRFFRNVPMDKEYHNAVYVGRGIGCTETFLENQLMAAPRHLFTLTDYTFLRETKNTIRVKMPSTSLYQVDYICFKNPPYGPYARPEKWYFAFVDSVNYVNNETSDVTFTIDLITTWWEEAMLKECFVERMHEPNDYFGKNLTPECFGIGDYKYALDNTNPSAPTVVKAELLNTRPNWTIIAINCASVDSSFWSGADHVVYYDGVLAGAKLYAFDDVITQSAQIKQLMQDTGANANDGGGILGIFTIPKAVLSDSDIVQDSKGYNVVASRLNGIHTDYQGYNFNDHLTLDGYLPLNTKMYSAPFCFCSLTLPNGECLVLRHEYMFANSGQSASFSFNTGVELFCNRFPPFTLIFRPYANYGCGEATGNYPDQSIMQIEFKDLPMGAYTFGAFERWMQQRFIPTLIQGATLTSIGSGMFNNGSNGVSQAISAQQGIQTARGASNLLIDTYNFLCQPPPSRGKVDANGLFASYSQSVEMKCMCVNHQDAERIDHFLWKYGYAQKKIMQPYRHSRSTYTYVQTVDCVIGGYLSAEDRLAISRIYNNGITFWVNMNDVGNYVFSRGANGCIAEPEI